MSMQGVSENTTSEHSEKIERIVTLRPRLRSAFCRRAAWGFLADSSVMSGTREATS